ncbi:hypothetical protein C2S53_006280 [Perilla frutescens var. hirtella]|uniref:NAC domain-containing protein n=1 Tax=Perilla frutescens var. hirtella TaxID=608512 RepID=A0AAD4IUC2_PERFH|nr:hypothetical protein C2S53_006280 [Perilla frutescens var. hirtella]
MSKFPIGLWGFGYRGTAFWNTNRDSNGTKKTIYVLTKVTKKTSKSKRVARRAGCGTWSGQTGPKIIKNSTTGDIVGYTKMLSFINSAEGDAKKLDLGHWIMHEYFLDGAALMEIGQRNNDLCLCKITKCVNDRIRNQQFSLPVIDNGGSGIPANTGTDIGGESRNKRPAEELQGEEFGCKRQNSCLDSTTHIGGSTSHQQQNGAMLDWDLDVVNIDDLFEGVEDEFPPVNKPN